MSKILKTIIKKFKKVYKMWIGRHLLIPVWSLSQGPPDDDDETTMNRGAIFNNSNNINSYRGLIHC